MKVLSLFDGMSCTQLALKNLGVNVETYYASEIDKYAIQIAQKNFPDTIQLGDIKDIKGEDLPEIDLIVAGSPCQGFSFAGKQLAFDDPRSALFFEFIRLLKEVKPKYFLLENVRMKKEHIEVINQQISEVYPEAGNGTLFGGIEPIKINSSLVSAQSRNRLYWTNIKNIEQPEDLGIVLRDILEPSEEWGERPQYLKNEFAGRDRGSLVKSIDEKSNCLNATMYKGQISTYVKKKAEEDLKKMTTKDGKSYALTASYNGAAAWNSIERKQRTMIPTYDTPKQVGVAADLKGHDIIKRVYSEDGKSPTLTTMGGGHREPKVAIQTSENGISNIKKGTSGRSWFFEQQTYSPDSDKTRALKAGSGSGNIPKVLNKDPKVAVKKKVNLKEYNDEIAINPRNFGGKGYVGTDKKSVALTQPSGNNATLVRVKKEELTWRKLTPLECERLQTVPDNYSEGVSNTQRYKMLGNGFTVKVIEHILQNME